MKNTSTKVFLEKTFREKSPKQMDEEYIRTIKVWIKQNEQKFLENNQESVKHIFLNF